nr:unnamed protein product [Spirometra erinaceieuropaei]
MLNTCPQRLQETIFRWYQRCSDSFTKSTLDARTARGPQHCHCFVCRDHLERTPGNYLGLASETPTSLPPPACGVISDGRSHALIAPRYTLAMTVNG